MALTGLDIYKHLPKTNCRECGFPTCLAFAMQLAKRQVALERCPYVKEETKSLLESASLPPIRLISIGEAEEKLEVGNETVMFRHEEKFHHPCGIGFLLEDNLKEEELSEKIEKIKRLKFERVGQEIKVNLIAIKQTGDSNRFIGYVKKIADKVSLGLVLMSSDKDALKGALEFCAGKKPLIYAAGENNYQDLASLAKKYNVPLAVLAEDLDKIADLTKKINELGVNDLILDTGQKPLVDKIFDLTQIRRLALKKSLRALGFPIMVVVQEDDPFREVSIASSLMAKYANIMLLRGCEPWQILPLLTLRQNIYTDPQKPLQVEPKVYPIGQVNEKSPVLVTTNFSLTYYTVLGEIEASKVSSYLMSVDTEGMSVLTAWAAEKFTPEKITESLKKADIENSVSHKNLIIPGYVAVISGDLEEQSGWKITVGPREAAGIPSFLRNI